MDRTLTGIGIGKSVTPATMSRYVPKSKAGMVNLYDLPTIFRIAAMPDSRIRPPRNTRGKKFSILITNRGDNI
jgi:hypothetical protein